MAKYPTYPTLIDELQQFRTKDLKALNYFNGLSYKGGTVNWKRGNEITASMSIKVNTLDDHPYIELDYSYKSEPLSYRLQLVSIPSNLGKGIVWYFICPNTGKRCRKLYLANGYFVSRFAFTHAMYEQQTQSHKTRNLHKVFGKPFGEKFKQLEKPYFKSHYAGKPTKKYYQIIKEMKQFEEFDMKKFHRLFK